MYVPATIYNDPFTATSYIYRVDANTIFPGLKWNDSPERNSDQLAIKILDGQFPELKTFINRYVSGCPFNDLSKSIDTNQLKTFQWQNDQEQKGFVTSHEGPCEIWIDNNRVFNHTNCARAYTAYPAIIPVDYSICAGTCQFEFYWITMQEPLWQIYKACATITHSTGASSPTMIPKSTTAPTTAPTTYIANTVPSGHSGTSIKLLCTEVAQ